MASIENNQNECIISEAYVQSYKKLNMLVGQIPRHGSKRFECSFRSFVLYTGVNRKRRSNF